MQSPATHAVEKSRDQVEPLVTMLHDITRDLTGGATPIFVEVFPDHKGARFVVIVDQKYLHLVNGPQGRTAQSLGVILRAAGIKLNRRFLLSIESRRPLQFASESIH